VSRYSLIGVDQRIGRKVPVLLSGRSSDQKSTSWSRSLKSSAADTLRGPFVKVTVTVSALLISSPLRSTMFTSDATRTVNVACSRM
jgi:hypothetical protein